MRLEVRSQDTGLLVLVRGSARTEADFSVKEKDEASPRDLFSLGSLSAFISRFVGV